MLPLKKLLLMAFLMLALPLQGFAQASSLFCMAASSMPPASSTHDGGHHEPSGASGHEHHADMTMLTSEDHTILHEASHDQASPGLAHHGSVDDKAGCTSQASCCHGAMLTAPASLVAAATAAVTLPLAIFREHASVIQSPLDRPPIFLSA